MAYTRNPNGIRAGVGLEQSPKSSPLNPGGTFPVTIDAKIATRETLGVVQIGDNISISPNGTISVNSQLECCDYETILVSKDYEVSDGDYYIGVNSNGPVSITLPSNINDGKKLIIKVEMKPPIGSRKVTIKTSDGTLIDGAANYVMETSYEVIRVIFRSNWYII